MFVVYILFCAIVFQLTAAVLALRLIRIAGRSKAWILISIALVLMIVRRALSLYNVLRGDIYISLNLTNEVIGLILSFLMMLGVADIAPLFFTLRKSKIKLKKSGERFLKLFNSSPIAISLSKLSDETYIDVNDSYMRLVGYSKEEILGRTAFELNIYPDPEKNMQLFRGLRERGSFQDYGVQIRTKSGNIVETLTSFESILIDNEKCVLTSIIDITERKQAAMNIRHLTRLYAMLIQVNQSIVRTKQPEELFQKICEAAVQYGGFHMTWVGLIDGKTGQVNPIAYAGNEDGYLKGVDTENRGIGGDNSPTGRALQEGKLVICEDIESDPAKESWRVRALERGYRSSASVPFHLRGEAVGVFTLYANEPFFFTIDQQQLLEEISKDISFSLDAMELERERAQTEDMLRESEKRYRQTLDNMMEGCQIIGHDWRYLYINEAAARHSRLEKEELLGHTMQEMNPGFENTHLFKILKQCRDDHVTHNVESEFIYPDGTKGWFDLSIQPSPDGIFILSVDITERKRAEKEILVREKRFHSTLDNMLEGCQIIGSDWRYIYLNDAADIHNRRPKSELLGKRYMDMWPGIEETEVFRIIKHSIEERASHHVENEFVFPDGAKGWFDLSIHPVPEGVFILSMDITERKHAELEILRLNRIYAVLSNINELLVRERNRQKLFEEACKIVVADGKFQMSWIGILNGDTDTLEPVAHSGISDGYLEILQNSVSYEVNNGNDPIGVALREGRYSTYNDIANDDRTPHWRDRALALGYKSMAAFPLRLGKNVEGVISFYSNELGFFDAKEVQLIEELAMDISFALESIQIEEQRKRAEFALHESYDFNELLLQTVPYGMDIVDEHGTILFLNNTMKSLIKTDVVEKQCWLIYKDNKSQCRDCPLRKGIEIGATKVMEVTGVLGGRTFQVSHVGMIYGGKKAVLEVFQDITEQKKLQLELLQTQKMQSIGTLAGGIAHDFNNILGIILGYTSILEKQRNDKQKHSESVSIINQSIQRGAALVRQILTFARKTNLEFEPFDLVDLVHELFSMLKQTFPRTITFTEKAEKNIPYLYADRNQIHQALLNLCVNARDAMPNGGTVTIEIKMISRSSLLERFPSADENFYVCITVSDTGEGMEEATRLRVFDPFFTTKEKGKGTGMGLPVVYGIVQAHRGFIEFGSEIKHGTTFSLYFPAPMINIAAAKSKEKTEIFDVGGNETILVVEDEKLLTEIIRFTLESKGYKVYNAQDGTEAIEIFKQHKGEVKLVLSDLGLAKMTGKEEFKKLKEIDPDVKVVFASGFFDNDIKEELINAGAEGFIQKPYETSDILRTVREVLDKK